MSRDIDTVLCVTTGDCSNTIMLMEVLKLRGLRAIPFAYPDTPNAYRMRHCLEALAESLNTSLEAAEGVRRELARSRHLAREMNELIWREGMVSGWDNHMWLVSTSDFNRDYSRYESELSKFVGLSRARQPYSEHMLRLAYIGVPSIFARDLYRYWSKMERGWFSMKSSVSSPCPMMWARFRSSTLAILTRIPYGTVWVT